MAHPFRVRINRLEAFLGAEGKRMWDALGLTGHWLVPLEDLLTFLSRMGPLEIAWEAPYWVVTIPCGTARHPSLARALRDACRMLGAVLDGETPVSATAWPRFGDRLCLAMARSRMAQRTVANALGCPAQDVTRLLSRVRPPSAVIVERLSLLLDVPVAWLVGDAADDVVLAVPVGVFGGVRSRRRRAAPARSWLCAYRKRKPEPLCQEEAP